MRFRSKRQPVPVAQHGFLDARHASRDADREASSGEQKTSEVLKTSEALVPWTRTGGSETRLYKDARNYTQPRSFIASATRATETM